MLRARIKERRFLLFMKGTEAQDGQAKSTRRRSGSDGTMLRNHWIRASPDSGSDDSASSNRGGEPAVSLARRARAKRFENSISEMSFLHNNRVPAGDVRASTSPTAKRIVVGRALFHS